jgi:hypothetical protein
VTEQTAYNMYDKQVTWSEGHKWPPRKGKRPVGDVGGPFDSIRTSFQPRNRPTKNLPGNNRIAFAVTSGHLITVTGDILPPYASFPVVLQNPYVDPSVDASLAALLPSQSDVEALGTKMIADALPTNPVASGSVALAELFREGIPSLIGHTLLKDKVHLFRSLGGEYLNVQFGWKPFIADLRSAAKAVVESEKILKQLQRDSGRRVTRHRSLSPDKGTYSSGTDYPVYPAHTPGWSKSGSYRYWSDTWERRTWFSGDFTYHFDPGDLTPISRIATEARLLYGLELTPEVLWNLAPWSWLVDWFSNVGPMLHNVSAFQQDGLVMHHGYVMDHATRRIRHGYRGYGWPDSTPWGNAYEWSVPANFELNLLVERKIRRQASPFGFGLYETSFTSRQWSILVALGLSRR